MLTPRTMKSRFQGFSNSQQYMDWGVRYCEPMTAKEIVGEEEQNAILNSKGYFIEEKFDGTRATLHLYDTRRYSSFHSFQDGPINFIAWESILTCFNSKIMSDVYDMVSSNQNIYELSVILANYFKDYGTLSSSRGTVHIHSGGITVNVKVAGSKAFETSLLWSYVSELLISLFTHGYFYPFRTVSRCFSRRVSVKTDWFVENTDSVPHIRDIQFPPEFHDCVIDGEMFVPGKPFKEVASILNSTWDKAVLRQEESGKVVFHAFDILYYKGICVEKLPLWRRKEFLDRVVKALNSPYVVMVPYYRSGEVITNYSHSRISLIDSSGCKYKYPELWDSFMKEYKTSGAFSPLTPRAFYEYIVASGGEGVMIKPIDGKYYHKRGREYQKIKKFLTREVIIMGFTDPTKEYKGKFPNDRWPYWLSPDGKFHLSVNKVSNLSASELKKSGHIPVSKYWYEEWVGNIVYGVVITDSEIKSLPKNKSFTVKDMTLCGKKVKVLEVGECSGFDENFRYMFTCNALDVEGNPVRASKATIEECGFKELNWIGQVIEVKANELFKDTGKLRHPRFLRIRRDKSPLDCTFKDHVSL